MASPVTRARKQPTPPADAADIPILYEDEEEEFDLRDSNIHTTSGVILYVCTKAHLAPQPELQVYFNMNLYYLDGPPHKKTGSLPYISPDVMVVRAFQRLPEEVKSYKIGRDGPAPIQAMEVLSERSGQQRDLGDKMVVYAKLGVEEYVVVDQTGEFRAGTADYETPATGRHLQGRASSGWRRDERAGFSHHYRYRRPPARHQYGDRTPLCSAR
jgi:Uma2 family endonuclease